MDLYGNKTWNDATDNRDKSLVPMQLAEFQRNQKTLENSGINYYAYAKGNSVVMAINDKDVDRMKNLVGDVSVGKSGIPYTPPEKNIIGNAEFRYIPQKEYVSADRDLILKMAELMEKQNLKFSGRIYPSGKGTLTVSRSDLDAVHDIQRDVVEMRKQFSTAEKAQEINLQESTVKEPTEEEVLFGQADLAKFLAERTLSSDEWEDMAYPLFENGYLDKYKPNDKAAYGYHMSEPALYDLAKRYHSGDDIRRELALGLMEHSKTDDIEFVFEDGKMTDRTYYYAENLRHSLHTEMGDNGIKCNFNGMEREVTYAEIGQAFLDRTHEEFDDLMYWRVLDDIKDDIPDISDDTVQKLITAFDGAALPDWEKGDNQPKLNRIKKTLFDILGNEEQTEKAFACIAKNKYNVTFDADEPEKQPDSLTFRFGKDDDEWISEGEIIDAFAKEHPDCSFALANAVLEYLDEKQHTERNIGELHTGWYKKTDFTIHAVVGGEEFNYDGRFDIGDGKGTGGGSLIDHIRDYNEGILEYTQYPFNQPEYKERAQHTLDIFVPFLEKNSQLTAEEQRIFDDFKAKNPIRTADDLEKTQGKFQIYQLPDGDKYHGIRFESMEQLEKDGVQLSHEDYALVYEGLIGEYHGNATLEALYTQFNTNRPEDFVGHSLSVSDVIVVDMDGEQTAYYCDAVGFTEMPEFFAERSLSQEKSALDLSGAESVRENIEAEKAPDMSVSDAEISIDKGPVTMRKIGDFYEMYGKNAEIAVDVLGLHNTPKNGSPMVGFPDFKKDEYSKKLGDAGYSVLIEEAFELFPPKREAEKQIETDENINLMSDDPKVSDETADIDKPLFTDASVIEEIQRNEHSDTPFWETPVSQGEQLSMFGGAEPIAPKATENQQKQEYVEDGLFVGGVNRFTALHDEILRGTGFVDGKKRVQNFYQENHPTNKELADFLKKEYGTGGHSGEGNIALVDHNSQGMFFTLESSEKFKFTWSDVAEFTSEMIDKGEYFTEKEQAADLENTAEPDTLEVGDKFRNKTTGDISEVVSLTGALPWYTDQCTVSRESGGFVITENISYDKLLNSDLYEYIDKTEQEKEQTAPVKSEPVKSDDAHESKKYEIPTVKNLAQLKRAIKPGMLFEITDHLRPECIGERRVVTGVTTVDFTSQKLDENGEPTGKDIHMEFDKAKNWSFNGDELTSHLDDGSVLMSFHFVDERVPEKEAVPAENPQKDNFTITDDSLGEGGAKSKFKANIAAIETLKTLEKENRPATDEEKETLSKYVGWGGIPQAFDAKNTAWSAEFAQLKELLNDAEYSSARASTLDAFYTSPAILDGIYEALDKFGFEGGNVLEPALGVGNFIGRMPEKMAENSKIYGTEIDSISGRIAQKLYPDADIKIEGFEKNSYQNGCFDVAVGNVPFGDLGFKDDKHGTAKLHDYFFVESLDKVKNGGIVAFVTSTGTLDKKDETTRQMLADKADFIGAIRLPSGAFKANAGTDVTSDIIFLKKHEGKSVAEMSDIPDWVHIGETADSLPINKYFEQHPDMVLGTVVKDTNPLSSGTKVIAEDGFDLKTALHEAVGKLSAEISPDKALDVYAKTEQGLAVKIPSNLRNFSLFMDNDSVYFKKNNAAFEFRFDKSSAQHKRFKAFIEVRDLTRELLEAQELNKPDSVIKDLQKQLNTAYDDFYKKYGLIHSQTNKRYFGEDVSYNLAAGLEKSYDKTKLKEKSDIFTKRTIIPPKAVEHVETAMEALTLSVAEKARVDFAYMGKLTGMNEEELKHDLTGEIFKVPHTENDYQTASEYLSGDIRAKLREAEEIAEYDADFNINVSALKKAMPEPLKAGDIDVKIGAAWLEPKYYEQFLYELLQTPQYQRSNSPAARWNKSAVIGVEYSEHSNSFYVSNKSADRSVLATQKYGSHKMNAYDIFEHILNLQEPKVYKTIEVPDGLDDVKEKRVVDVDATRVVQRKADDMRKAFKEWIFKDPTRREDIVNRYNELFNSIRPREYDGSALKFPMMTTDIKLHDHQKNAIAHAMFGGNTLFAHSVGAGKTFEMIATAMESKRLGLCTKSLFAVPNHLTEQIGDDFQKLYPSANILVATKKDFKKENRQQLFAKIATGNFDAVIIGHSQLGMIPVSKERQIMTIQSQIDDILQGIDELKRKEGSKFQVKAMERTRKNLQKQLDKLEKTNQDDTLTFEQLGVDKLFIDEAHEFKNLFVNTKLNNVAGISSSASQKALDLFLKCRYLDEKTGGKGVTFATGTPYASPYQL